MAGFRLAPVPVVGSELSSFTQAFQVSVNETLAALIPMLMSALGGLGIFMLGMKYMSEGMQAVAGNSLRRMISLITNNRFTATATGTGVTVLVQSSTVTTVLVVGMVNAGVMQLHQAVGVIFGANIGTTITGWILVLKIGAWGLPILGAAALAYLFSRRDRPKFIAMAIMGLGMAFFGLELMKNGFAPMKDVPTFVEAFAWFNADTYWGILKCVLVGCLLTFIVQSSSATLGITIGLAATGVIPFTTAAALVLGENIGTTITIVLAAIGGRTVAKQAAAAHVLFNAIGSLWIVALFPWYIRLISSVIEGFHGIDPTTMTMASVGDAAVFGAVMTAAIALTHSGFNITNTLAFLPFIKPYTRMLEKLFPEPAVKEVSRLRHLDARGVASPVLGVEQSRGEVVAMGRSTLKMGDWIRSLAYEEGVPPAERKKLEDKVERREEVLDNVQSEIIQFLNETLDATVPVAILAEGRQQLRLAHEYESVADRLASVARAFRKLEKQDLSLSDAQRNALAVLHDQVMEYLSAVTEAYRNRAPLTADEAAALHSKVTTTVRGLRAEHLEFMTRERVPPGLALLYAGILTDYRRIRAHAQNIHETMVDAPLIAAANPT
jgi:phosphate:Na+ symporter